MPRLGARLLLVSTMLLVSGCFSTEKAEPELAEIKPPNTATIEGAEAELFRAGKRLYANGLYSVARESFEALRANYPSSPLGEFAELKIADSYFDTGEYLSAQPLYEQFLKSYPLSGSAPYAMLQAGRSAHLAYRGPGRDPSGLHKSLAWYERILNEHPHSVYAPKALELRKDALSSLAEHESYVERFYRRREVLAAAERRAQARRERWEPLVQQATQALQVTRELQQSPHAPSPTVLAIARRAPTLTEPNEERPSHMDSERAAASYPGSVIVERVGCRDGTIALYLSKPFEPSGAPNRITIEDGVASLALSEAGGSPISTRCDQIEVTYDGQGSLSLRNVSADSLQVVPIRNPDRLLLVPRSARG